MAKQQLLFEDTAEFIPIESITNEADQRETSETLLALTAIKLSGGWARDLLHTFVSRQKSELGSLLKEHSD